MVGYLVKMNNKRSIKQAKKNCVVVTVSCLLLNFNLVFIVSDYLVIECLLYWKYACICKHGIIHS